MRIWGLPLASFLLLIVVPGILMGIQFFYCLLIHWGKKE